MKVIGASVFRKHSVGCQKQQPTGLEDTEGFLEINLRIGDMFQDLRGQDGVVSVSGFSGRAVCVQETIDLRTRNDVGTDVVFAVLEEIPIRCSAASVVVKNACATWCKLSDDAREIRKWQAPRVPKGRPKPLRKIFRVKEGIAP